MKRGRDDASTGAPKKGATAAAPSSLSSAKKQQSSTTSSSLSMPPQKKPPQPSLPLQQQQQQQQQQALVPSFATLMPPLSASTLQSISHVLNKSNPSTASSSSQLPPTPVQFITIPLLLTNKDVVVQALTGSGKTLAYVVPLVELLLRAGGFKPNQLGALVLLPTRELAIQVNSVVQVFARTASMAPPLLAIGGGAAIARTKGEEGGEGEEGGAHAAAAARTVMDDLRDFAKNGCDVMVGTPGRVHDLLTRYDAIDCRSLELLVLDEADTLLNMGFEKQISGILKALPTMRRTGLFSATMTRGVKELSRAGMRNPVVVNVTVNAAATPAAGEGSAMTAAAAAESGLVEGTAAADISTPSSLRNYYLVSPLEEKISRLAAFLLQHRDEKAVVFFLTCACVDFYGNALSHILSSRLSYLESLHGKMVQKRRSAALARFREAKAGALLCTDVAARGLDVTDVQWVVQVDAPLEPSYFVHRVGRAARAGRMGRSVIFLTEKEESYVDFLRLRKVPIEEMTDEAEDCTRPVVAAGTSGGASRTIPEILSKIKSLVLSDRDYLEKGTSAFTSYVRAYKEHSCTFIFRFPSLDLGSLASSFSLLRLPKMPELKENHKSLNFVPAGADVDIYAIPFKDKTREKARQIRLAKELEAGGKNAKQIKAEQKAADKIRRQQEKKEEAIKKGRNPNKKRGKQQQMYDDWDELAKEERLNKKLKKGKITKEQFKALMREGGGGGDKKKGKKDEDSDDDDFDDDDEEEEEERGKKGVSGGDGGGGSDSGSGSDDDDDGSDEDDDDDDDDE